MYGYIRIYQPELKFREYDAYRGMYCGLCRNLQTKYGGFARFSLSYDLTFLAMILDGVYEPKETIEKRRCIANPFQKQLQLTSSTTEYAADMSILLFYYKCLDDWQDDKRIDKLSLAKAYKGYWKKAVQKYPKKAEIIQQELEQLHQFEAQQECDFELPAGCFGRIFGEIFAPKEDFFAEDLRQMGFYLGKFIYCLDALEDMEQDRKKKRYNPFLLQESLEQPFTYYKEMLSMTMGLCTEHFERLPILKNVEILKNILYAGIWQTYEKHLEGEKHGSI